MLARPSGNLLYCSCNVFCKTNSFHQILQWLEILTTSPTFCMESPSNHVRKYEGLPFKFQVNLSFLSNIFFANQCTFTANKCRFFAPVFLTCFRKAATESNIFGHNNHRKSLQSPRETGLPCSLWKWPFWRAKTILCEIKVLIECDSVRLKRTGVIRAKVGKAMCGMNGLVLNWGVVHKMQWDNCMICNRIDPGNHGSKGLFYIYPQSVSKSKNN